MTNNYLDKLVALISRRKLLVERHSGCNEEREHVIRTGNRFFYIEEHDQSAERDISYDGFLLVFSLLPSARTNHDYNEARTLLFQLMDADAVQFSKEDSVLEPCLCATTRVRRDYQQLYDAEKAKIQQAWKDYETVRQKIEELKLTSPIQVKEPDIAQDMEPDLPLHCLDTIYSIDYSQVRWSFYADKNTEIWRSFVRNNIEI